MQKPVKYFKTRTTPIRFNPFHRPVIQTPEYFKMYENMLKESKNIEMQIALREVYKQDKLMTETDLDCEEESIEMKETENGESIQMKAKNKKRAQAKKKRNKRKHGREINVRMH